MPDVKISALPAATTVSDVDVLVINQGSPATTKKIPYGTLLPAVGVNTGSFGSDSAVAQVTVDSKGRVTAATNVPINASSISTGTLPVVRGGTGAATLTGFVKASGTNAMTASATVALGSEVAGTLPVANGGTGAATLAANGYLKGNGTSAITSQTGVPVADITGTLGLDKGGTSATTQQAAINALAGVTTSGQYLRGNGTNVVMSALQAADLTGVAPTTAQPALTGDVTCAAGSTVTTLAASGVSPFTYGTSSRVGTFTVNAKGIITNAIQTDIDPVAIGAISTTQGGTISSAGITGTALNISCANSQYAIRTTTQIASPTFLATTDLLTGTSITTNGVSLKAGAGVTFGASGTQTNPYRIATGASSPLSLSISNNTQQVVTVLVANAGFGVPAFASLSASPSLGLALIISAYCSSAGTVTVVIRNESGATIGFTGTVFAHVLY